MFLPMHTQHFLLQQLHIKSVLLAMKRGYFWQFLIGNQFELFQRIMEEEETATMSC